MEGATTHPLGLLYAATTTGLPRRNGFACCSIVQNAELRSTCIIVALFLFTPSAIQKSEQMFNKILNPGILFCQGRGNVRGKGRGGEKRAVNPCLRRTTSEAWYNGGMKQRQAATKQHTDT